MKNNHPLVCRFGALGDMVLITPLLKRLYERSGLPADLIAIGEWNKTLFEHMPYVRDVYTIKSRKTPYIINPSQKKIVQLLKKNNYENTWICESNKKSIQLMKRAGITPDRSTSAYAFPRSANEHFVNYWLRLADISPDSCDYTILNNKPIENTELFVTHYEIEVCKNWLRTRGVNHRAPLICIQAGNKRTTRAGNRKRASNIKYWPETDWAKVIDSIAHPVCDA